MFPLLCTKTEEDLSPECFWDRGDVVVKGTLVFFSPLASYLTPLFLTCLLYISPFRGYLFCLRGC